MTRRTLLLVVGAAVVVVAAALVLALQRDWIHVGPRPAALAPAGAQVRAFFGPLGDGAKLAEGAIVRVYDLDRGGIPVVLRTSGGHRCGITVLKRDPNGTQGVANTQGLSLFIGNGGKQTVEEEAQAARALASALADREQAAQPPPLLTLSERQRIPGGARLAVPLE